jgi:3-oxoacyl-[acyl-carrier protein] reductase
MRIVIVTGANGALGQAIAQSFIEESPENFVWLGIHQQHDHAEKLAGTYPGRCGVIQLDVTQAEVWRSAVSQIIAAHSRVDVLVNNAGRHADSLLATMPVNVWTEVLRVNLEGAFHGCQAVLPAMISQRNGRIVNVSSLSGLVAPPGQTNYAAAKAGLIALTQSLAKEVARLNITVNAICPGFIDTEALADMSAEARKTAEARIPMRRFGRPAEIAAAVRFLACSEASYITGSVLKVDGGIF